MAKGAFNLCKWHSNSSEVLQLIKNKKQSIARTNTEKANAVVEEEDESFIKFFVGPTRTADTLVKTLGVCWNTATDEISSDFTELIESANTMQATKRSVLQLTHSQKFQPVGGVTLGLGFQCGGWKWGKAPDLILNSLSTTDFMRIIAYANDVFTEQILQG